MCYRFSLLLLIVFVATAVLAQSPLQYAVDMPYRAALSGVVYDQFNHPLPNARIEVQDVMTGRSVTTAYTAPNGSFEILNLRRGEYEVVASAGISESRTRVDLDLPRDLTFRLNTQQGVSTKAAPSVSLSQMKVPGKARKLFQKAVAAFRAAHLDDAFKFVEKALVSCPDYAQALTLRGILNLQKGDTQSAQPDLEKAVELDYGDDTSFVALASLYNTEGRFDEALRVLDRGMRLKPNSWQALMETARAENGKKQYQEALKSLAKMEQYAPAEMTLKYLYRAQAFIGLQNYPAAVTELETYLQREKSGPNVDGARKTLEQLRTAVVEEARK